MPSNESGGKIIDLSLFSSGRKNKTKKMKQGKKKKELLLCAPIRLKKNY
jgi:hypothetical protein